MDGPSVFLSPLAEAEFSEDIWYTCFLSDSLNATQESRISLLVWNPGKIRVVEHR